MRSCSRASSDLQDTLINRGGYQNIGHKALRARALVDIADYFGWDNAHEVIYTVVPDLGCSPRLYGLWTEISNICQIELPDTRRIPKRSDEPLTERELDELTEAHAVGRPVRGQRARSWRSSSAARGILDIGDGVAVGFQRYLIDVLEHPNAFKPPDALVRLPERRQHLAAQLRQSAPGQGRRSWRARFVNDAIRSNAMFPRDPKFALAPRTDYRAWADDIAVDRCCRC